MTPADRAAAILAELAESPEVAALVAADIGNLDIAREWEPFGRGWARWGIVRGVLPVAEVMPSRGPEWTWCVEDRPRLGGICGGASEGSRLADEELRRRGWKLL